MVFHGASQAQGNFARVQSASEQAGERAFDQTLDAGLEAGDTVLHRRRL
jgi:hypothetical protein